VRLLPRKAAIILAMMSLIAWNMNFAEASAKNLPASDPFACAAAFQEESGAVHRPLGTVGVTAGETLRINVVNSPDPNSGNPPGPIAVELCFHDANGELILDRSRLPVQKTATIEAHHGDFLDLNASLVSGPGTRVVIVPCVRILSIGPGSLAATTVEIFNNLLKTTFVLNPGIARGFDPQPDPPVLPDAAFGLVGITQGVTARLYVVNAQNPNLVGDPHGPLTVELEFHDENANTFLDRTGRPSRKTVTLDPNQAGFIELNGNDIAALGTRVGIIPCVKVLRGLPTSLVAPTFEMYVNITQQTLLLSNFPIP